MKYKSFLLFEATKRLVPVLVTIFLMSCASTQSQKTKVDALMGSIDFTSL